MPATLRAFFWRNFMNDREWPIIDDLPEEEQKPFREYLAGQTRPVNKDKTVGYYSVDYETW